MKTVHHINLTLYFGVIFFMLISLVEGIDNSDFGAIFILGPIILGITQPLLAFILLVIVDRSKKGKIKGLNYYFMGVAIFFLLVSIMDYFHLDYPFILAISSFIPPILATYFIFVTYKIQKSRKK